MGLAPYKKTDSVISKAGIDGAAFILHAWDEWKLNQGPEKTKMGWVPTAAGTGTSMIFGDGKYDVYTRDSPQCDVHPLRDGKIQRSHMDHDSISAIIVQLAHDVQRWRCIDGPVIMNKNYRPCNAWQDDKDGVKKPLMATFDEFENRLGTYFSNGCPTALKMPQCNA